MCVSRRDVTHCGAVTQLLSGTSLSHLLLAAAAAAAGSIVRAYALWHMLLPDTKAY
jgi:hypothetical protein